MESLLEDHSNKLCVFTNTCAHVYILYIYMLNISKLIPIVNIMIFTIFCLMKVLPCFFVLKKISPYPSDMVFSYHLLSCPITIENDEIKGRKTLKYKVKNDTKIFQPGCLMGQFIFCYFKNFLARCGGSYL
jgi:hypothetical protein